MSTPDDIAQLEFEQALVVWSLFGLSLTFIIGITYTTLRDLLKYDHEHLSVLKDQYTVFYITFVILSLVFKLAIIDTHIKDEIKKTEQTIAAEREPLLEKAKQLEQDGKLNEAYRIYQKVLEVDPMEDEAPAGMKRIKGVLTDRAKHIYTEGVFAESYGDMEAAEKKFREVLESVPKEDEYYEKAESKLKKLTVFKRAGSPEGGSL